MKAASIPNRGLLKYIDKAFNVSIGEMRKIMRDFHLEMERGLSGRKSSLKMIPTYVDRPTGEEKGNFIALDLGGTHFRILELELKGNGKYKISRVRRFVLGDKLLTGTAKEFFDFIARCVETFIKEEIVATQRPEQRIGFTFSFPVEQTGVASGTLVRWTKGFNVKGVLGKDVVRLLNEAFARIGLHNVRIEALANDTVGTLVARGYEDRDCDVGVILGTGTNACYVERLSNIPKWHGPETPTGRMIINIEWGNFNKLHLTSYDKRLDELSDKPGQQILEKMVSGMYLGEVARFVFKDLVKRNILFKGINSSVFDRTRIFKTEYMSAIESDNSANLSRIGLLLKKTGIRNSTIYERRLIKKICKLVSLRAARVSSSALAGAITKIDPNLSRPHTVAIDGTVYEKHPLFSKNMKRALRELFGRKASWIEITLTKDGSGKGAAIMAALAASI